METPVHFTAESAQPAHNTIHAHDIFYPLYLH
jgi:hypothetical protein